MRYIVQQGSDSGHCCFDFSVMDTETPVTNMFDGGIISDATMVCECFERKEADMIAEALNK
mgnify:CR=1 FL=1|tara:strand:- start:31844 stop:32026 length:183 start_codon:yes stop_codon:yes gene_type:complete